MNHALKFGLFYGIASIAVALIQAYIFPNSLVSGISTIVSLAVPIIFMWLAGKATRDDNDGLLSFGEAMSPTFLTYLIGSLISVLFMFILYNFISPDLLLAQAEMAADMAVNMAEKIGGMAGETMSAEQLDEMRQQALTDGSTFSFAKAMITWLMGLIFGLILALIISAIIKRNPSA